MNFLKVLLQKLFTFSSPSETDLGLRILAQC